jgi:5-(carboxyamino)imidazole ribonucleotide mutase
VAAAGGAAHLGGVVAAHTTRPVIGIPIQSSALNGLDSLLSIVQMPGGVPVATMAIGGAGAKNAGLFAVQILALSDRALAEKLIEQRREQTEKVLQKDQRVQSQIAKS